MLKPKLSTILRPNSRSFVLAMDHCKGDGITPGLEDPSRVIDLALSSSEINAVMTSFGVLKHYHDRLVGHIPTIVRIDGGPSFYREDWLKFTQWRLMHTVEDALTLGVDAVVVMLFLASDVEVDTMEILARVAGDAMKYGMPVLVEALPCPASSISDPMEPLAMANAARIAFEHGADLLKCYFTGTVDNFSQVTANCPAPVLIAGGKRMDSERDVFQTVSDSIRGGGSGVVFGRNIWQHERPEHMIQAISQLLDERITVEQALELLK